MPRRKSSRGTPRARRGKSENRPYKYLPTPWDDLKATGRTASRALSVFKGAVNLLNAEVKSVEQTISAAIDNTGAAYFLSGIAQGDLYNERNGNSVKLKGGSFRYTWSINAAGSRAACRFLLIADTRCAGSLVTLSDILDTTAITGMVSYHIDPNRYVVLSDETVTLSTTGNQIAFRDVAIPAIEDAHLVFTDVDATAASATSLALFLVVLTSEAANTPTFNGQCRLLFIDN